MKLIQNHLRVTIKTRLFGLRRFTFVIFAVLLIALTAALIPAYAQKPSPPTLVSVTVSGTNQCLLIFDASTDRGGSPINGYAVSRTTGLNGGQTFVFYVDAFNLAVGQKGLAYTYPCDPKQLTVWNVEAINDQNYRAQSKDFALIPPDVPINLKSAVNGRFLMVDVNRYSCMIAQAAEAKNWEKFWLVTNADGYVSLRAGVNGKYLTVQQTNGQLQALATSIVDDDDKFKLIKNSDGTVSLQSGYNAKWISTDMKQGAYVLANAKSGKVPDITQAEKFYMTTLPN